MKWRRGGRERREGNRVGRGRRNGREEEEKRKKGRRGGRKGGGRKGEREWLVLELWIDLSMVWVDQF